MEKSKIYERKDVPDHVKRESSLKDDFLFFMIFLAISLAIFYVYYKVFTKWLLFLLAFFILLFGFELTLFTIIQKLQKKFPSSSITKYSDFDLSLLLSLILILPFYYLTKSTIIAIIFYIFLIGGLYCSGLRKIISINLILTVISLIVFHYAYRNIDLFFYILSTLMLTYFSRTISEYLGRNLENKNLIRNSISFFIISFSIALFSYRFIEIKTINTIFYISGLLGSVFFGLVFVDQSFRSNLKNVLIFNKEDEFYAFTLSFAVLSLILFGVFLFYKQNVYILIIASLFLAFGGWSTKLLLNRYFPDKESNDISISISFGILGVMTTIFYIFLMRESIILLTGIVLILFSLKTIFVTIRKLKLEFEGKV